MERRSIRTTSSTRRRMFWQTSAGFAGVAVLRSGRVLHTGRSPDVLANVRQVRWRRRPSIGTRLTYGTVAGCFGKRPPGSLASPSFDRDASYIRDGGRKKRTEAKKRRPNKQKLISNNRADDIIEANPINGSRETTTFYWKNGNLT